MAVNTFEPATAILLVHEGGYVNHPKDPGGATNRGVTQRTYDGWRKRRGLEPASVRNITTAEVYEIYKSQYWDAVKGDALPVGLDYAVYDFSVNSGASRAASFLQELLEVTIDGVIGNETLSAVLALSQRQIDALIVTLCERRLAWMMTLSTWKTFGKGWKRRVMGEFDGVQIDDVGVIDRAMQFARGATAQIPTLEAPGKARSSDVKATSKVKDEFFDLDTITKAATGAAAPVAVSLVEGSDVLQWAAAAVVVMVGAAFAFAFFKRHAKATRNHSWREVDDNHDV